MAQSPLELRIVTALEERSADHAIDVVDVEVAGATKAPVVRVRIDHADESLDGISLDEIASQNGWISEAIDEIDPFPGPWNLEVSSPGLDRPLRRPHDFEHFAGSVVSVSTKAPGGRRKFTGELLGLRDGKVVLALEGGELALDLSDVASAKIKPNYDELVRASKSTKEG